MLVRKLTCGGLGTLHLGVNPAVMNLVVVLVDWWGAGGGRRGSRRG